jgi:hypothetical protein
MKTKVVVWTVKLTTDGPIEQTKIVEALAGLGKAEVVTYAVKTVK